MKKIFKSSVAFLLALESRMVLKKYKPKIVAVTGTVGKTSTKDAIYTALSKTLSVRKTKKSQNSEFGLPLTILGEENPVETMSMISWLKILAHGLDLILMPHHYPEWLVLEIGADHPHDIERAVEWVKPDVSVVTKLSKVPVHVEFFSSVEAVAREKSFLVRGLKEHGTAVLNADDEDVRAFKDLAPGRVIFFGLGKEADIRAEGYEIAYDDRGAPSGIRFEVIARSSGERSEVFLKGTLGSHLVYSILAALSVTEAVGEQVEVAAKAFLPSQAGHEPTPGRMRIIEGKGETTIIDDTYNSSPVALEEGLKTLSEVRATRRIAVLGDMLELGKFSIEAHKKAGLLAKEYADVLVTIGPRMAYAAESARAADMTEVYEFDDSRKAGGFLETFIKPGDILFVKASQGIRAERVVKILMRHPEDVEKLLVRMDREWRERDARAG